MTLFRSFCNIPVVAVNHDVIAPAKVFSTWMAFGGNTRDLGSFGEETNKITNLHQILEEVLLIEHGDGVAGIKRRRRDPSSDGVRRFSDGCLTAPLSFVHLPMCVYYFTCHQNLRIRINALALSDRHPTYHETPSDQMDDPNITMEEYIRREEEKAHRRTIVFNDMLTTEASLSCEPTVSSLNNDEINFRISFEQSDDEDCTDLNERKEIDELVEVFTSLEVLES
ncbi:hypothetical protein Tco_0117905 [Tanacetum coccineum]